MKPVPAEWFVPYWGSGAANWDGYGLPVASWRDRQ